MSRSTRFVAALVLAAPVAFFTHHVYLEAARQAQTPAKTGAPAAPKKTEPMPGPMKMEPASSKPAMTDAQKIANAESAGPAQISKHAAIMDWTPDGKMKQIRAGTNGWTCMPDSPIEVKGVSGADPMCLDKSWQAWVDAYSNKAAPKIGSPGIGYMLHGDKGASNIDPNATEPTATNQWVVAPAHVMLIFPDAKMLDAFPTDPKTGGPWVMFKGTPYAHVMVPVDPTKIATIVSPKK